MHYSLRKELSMCVEYDQNISVSKVWLFINETLGIANFDNTN